MVFGHQPYQGITYVFALDTQQSPKGVFHHINETFFPGSARYAADEALTGEDGIEIKIVMAGGAVKRIRILGCHAFLQCEFNHSFFFRCLLPGDA